MQVVRHATILLCALLLLTSACSTATYQPYTGVGSGFSETLIASDTYKVTFEGRAPTKRLNAFVMYRCAELAIAKGFPSFNLVYGYNANTKTLGENGKSIAIIRFDASPSGDQRMGWYDASRTLEELSPLLNVPSHEFVSNPRSSFDLDYTEVILYPFLVTTIDSHTYRLQLSLPEMTSSSSFSIDWFKLLDLMLWHRLAQFTVDSGADYFVILSGSGRIGTYRTGWGQKNTYYHPYNERSVIVQLYKGERPALLKSAFLAQDILESAATKFHLSDEKNGKVATSRSESLIGNNGRIRETPAVPQEVLFRDPSMISYKRTPADLEERLFVRCAEVTLADGYDYFAFVKDDHVPPWQQDTPGEFVENSYAGGTPVFSGDYDLKYDDIRVRIQKFRKGDVPAGLFVFDAADIMHNIGQRL